GPAPALDEMAALSAKFGTPASIEACMMYRDLIREKPGDMYGPIAERILAAEKFSGTDIAALYCGMEKLTRAYLEQTVGIDHVAYPLRSRPYLPNIVNTHSADTIRQFAAPLRNQTSLRQGSGAARWPYADGASQFGRQTPPSRRRCRAGARAVKCLIIIQSLG